jgi:enoyl-CoA hydratase/carnithine racemase
MPTIAALDGAALGGGLELALACDIRLAKTGIELGLTESRLGGLAGSGSVRLARLVGPARAKQMLFTGETIDAERALQWGIVNEIAVGGRLLDQ